VSENQVGTAPRESVLRRVGLLLWVVPPLVFSAVFLGYPLGMLVYTSLRNKNIPLMIDNFAGLANYARLFSSWSFYAAVLRTLAYIGVCVGASLVGGLFLAVLNASIERHISRVFSRVLHVIIILPLLVMPAAAAVMWAFALTEQYGWVNYLLSFVGIRARAWLATYSAFYWAMLADIWSWTPYMYLILLAGIQGIPEEPLEAARIDGASRWQSFLLVTLPLLKRVLLIAIILKTIDTSKAFDYLWIMTRGGPGEASTTLNVHLFKTAFRMWDIGGGAAIGVCILWLVLGIVLVLFKVSRLRKVD